VCRYKLNIQAKLLLEEKEKYKYAPKSFPLGHLLQWVKRPKVKLFNNAI